jgi:hypothetical protein
LQEGTLPLEPYLKSLALVILEMGLMNYLPGLVQTKTLLISSKAQKFLKQNFDHFKEKSIKQL